VHFTVEDYTDPTIIKITTTFNSDDRRGKDGRFLKGRWRDFGDFYIRDVRFRIDIADPQSIPMLKDIIERGALANVGWEDWDPP
jgi:hypothetical protein